MIRTLRTVSALLVFVAAAHSSAQQPDVSRMNARIDSLVQAELIGKGATSVSLAITRGSQNVLTRTWGASDVDAKRHADTATAYRLGSMSKHVTAALLLKLVDQGKLNLSDTLGMYVAGLKPEWTGRPIEMFLNHTSGVPREYRETGRIGESLSTDELIALARRSTAPTVPAGSKFIYSNTGYMLLAVLVEKLYGRPYSSVLRDEIARPLGLSTFGWCADLEARGRVAKGYMYPPNGPLSSAPFVHPTQLLAGGICSNAADIARWNYALHTGRVLSTSSYHAMTTPHGVAAIGAVPYGYGMYVRTTTGGDVVMLTDGSTPGYANENVWYPAHQLSVTLLTNTSGPVNANLNITERIGDIVLGRPTPPAKQ